MLHRLPALLVPLVASLPGAMRPAASLPSASLSTASVPGPQDPQPSTATLTVQGGHSTGILQVLSTPDERFVITVPEFGEWTGSVDQFPMVWDTWSGRQLRRLRAAHSASILCAALSADGERLLTGDEAGGLWLSDVNGTEAREVLQPPYVAPLDEDYDDEDYDDEFVADPQAEILACEFLDGEGLLVCLDSYGVLTLIEDTGPEQDPDGVREPRRIELGPEAVSACSPRFSEDGRFLVTATDEETVVVRHLPSADVAYEFEAAPGWLALRAAPDGSWFAAGTQEGTVLLWRAPFDEEALELEVVAPVFEMFLDPDAELLMFFDQNEQQTAVWDTEDEERVGEMDGLPMGTTPDGAFAFSTPFSEHEELANHTVRMLDVEDGEVVMEYGGLVSPLTHLALSGDGRVLVTADLDDMLDVWDLADGLPVDRQPLWRRCGSLSLSDDGRWMAVSASPIVSWDPDEGDVPGVTFLVDHWDAGLVREFPGQVSVLSSDGRMLVTGDDTGQVLLWDVEVEDPLRVLLEGQEGGDGIASLDLSEASLRLACGFAGGTAYVLDLESGDVLMDLPHASHVDLSPDGQWVAGSLFEDEWNVMSVEDPSTSVALPGSRPRFLPDGRHLTARLQDTLLLYDVETWEVTSEFHGFGDRVEDVVGSRDGRWLWAASRDGIVSLFDLQAQERVGRLVAFQGEDPLEEGDEELEGEFEPGEEEALWEAFLPWAVIDESGRFDAANGGWVEGLHWVIGDEVVSLEQLADSFFQPGLLTSLLDPAGADVREVVDLSHGAVGLHPEVKVERAPTRDEPGLELTVIGREGGGIGRVAIYVNGIEFLGDARDPGADPAAERLTVRADLSTCPHWRGDEGDVVEAMAFNRAENLKGRVAVTAADLVGRGGRARSRPTTVPTAERGRFHAVILGVANYAGDDIDLNYAARDARVFGKVVRSAAERFHGADRVQVTVLEDSGTPATRENVLVALDALESSTPQDTVLIYMAGHGVTQQGEYHFLLPEASGFDLSDAATRARVTLSASELTERLKRIPALRRVVILDTCNSGQIITNMVGSRGADAERAIALQRLKDRSGTFVLAGSAADQKSYESNRFGQGLLTYSLLLGMTGKALREDVFVDVQSLFAFALDRVPELAKGVPGSQRPQMAVPGAGAFSTFDIGELQEEDRQAIVLPKARPMVQRTTFALRGEPADPLDLAEQVHSTLKAHARSDEPRLSFLNDDKITGAYRVAGLYSQADGQVELEVFVYLGKERVGKFEVQGRADGVQRLADEVLRRLLDVLPK